VPPEHRRYFHLGRQKVNYLTHVSLRHRAVFLEVPKAGCTVVKTILQYSENGGRAPEGQDSVHKRATSPLSAPFRDDLDLDDLFGPESDFFTFTFVRNPYSRALSCYLEKIVGKRHLSDVRRPKLGIPLDAEVSFREFLEAVARQKPRGMDIHWAPQATLAAFGKIQHGFVGRFESFGSDLRWVIDRLGLEAPAELVDRPTSHTTNARDRLMEYYEDERCGALVREIYRDDFRRLGYGVDVRFA